MSTRKHFSTLCTDQLVACIIYLPSLIRCKYFRFTEQP